MACIFTSAYLLSNIRTLLNDVAETEWSDDELNKWVQEAAMDISTKTLGYEVKDSIVTAADTLEYDEPADCIKVQASVLVSTSTITFSANSFFHSGGVRLSSEYCAVVYPDSDGTGKLRTFQITSIGTLVLIDSYVFDSSTCTHAHIANVDGNIYAITYDGPSVKMIVKTISISAAGEIIASIIDTWQLGDNTDRPFAVKVSSTVFALFTGHNDTSGYCFTIAIANDGTIATADANWLDSLLFDSNNSWPNKAVNMTGDMWFVANDSTSGIRGFTFEIDSSGNISNAVIDIVGIEVAGRTQHDIIRISSTIVACVFTNSSSKGTINTYSVDGAGNISAVDTHELTSHDIYDPYIQYSGSGNTYAVYYHAVTGRIIKTVDIDSSGNITASGDDPLTFSSNYYAQDATYLSTFLTPSGYFYPVLYGENSVGYLKAVWMGTDSQLNIKHKGLSQIHPRLVNHVSHNVVGEPVHWYHHHNKIGIWPLSDNAYEIGIYCSKVTDDITDIPCELRPLAILYAVAKARLSKRSKKEFAMFMSIYRNSLNYYRQAIYNAKLEADAKDQFEIPDRRVINAST